MGGGGRELAVVCGEAVPPDACMQCANHTLATKIFGGEICERGQSCKKSGKSYYCPNTIRSQGRYQGATSLRGGNYLGKHDLILSNLI